MTAWCADNRIDPETMYLHYDTPTTVNCGDGNGAVSLPGPGGTYSDGTPAPLGARVPTYGWYGNIGLPYKTGSRVVMNVGNPNYQAWANSYYLSEMQGGGYTGLFIDDSDGGCTAPAVIPELGTVVPSGTQVFNEYPSASGMDAAAADWCSDYVACIAASRAAFGSAYSIYVNVGNDTTNWTALLPYVNGVYRESLVEPMDSNSTFTNSLNVVAAAQAAGVSNVISCTNLCDTTPPTSALCYPGYFYSDNAISALAQYYLMANPGDHFGNQDTNSSDPLAYFNFGALNYNVGSPISSGNTSVVASTGPTGAYVFATGIDPSSPLRDSGTGAWVKFGNEYVLTDPTKNWTVNEWQNLNVVDAAGNAYEVYASTNDTIVLYDPSQPPVSGSYQVGSYTYTVYARQYGNALVLYKPTVGWPDEGPAGITAASATIANAGSGYTNDDIVTVQGGTYAYGAQAQFELTVTNGVVTAATLYNGRAGNYSVFPTGPVTVTGGTGSGLTLNLTQTPGTLSTATTLNLPASPTGNWYFLNADYNGVVSNMRPLTQISLSDGEAAILVTKPSSARAGPGQHRKYPPLLRARASGHSRHRGYYRQRRRERDDRRRDGGDHGELRLQSGCACLHQYGQHHGNLERGHGRFDPQRHRHGG